ncbi:MAG: hypothetical protein Q6352_007580 [Candidatus Freyrarchaeum guaymaensis]|nr:hypothetical protein [Candidatus Sigynarchaeota archaeon]
MSVKPGMSAKEIAILHYKLMMENNKEEWLKTIRKRLRDKAERYGSGPYFWWDTGKKRVDEQKCPTSLRMRTPGSEPINM